MAILITVLAAQPGAAQTAPPAGVGEPPPYRLRAGDAVRLLVRDEAELTGEYPVLEDGSALLPLIGLVPVADADFAEVRERVRVAYGRELVGREVVVEPLLRVRVEGEVRQPGLYLVDATLNVNDVVARAGGLLPAAAADRVLLVREGGAQRFDLRPDRGARTPALRPADAVFVPRRSWLRESAPLVVGAATSVLAAAVTALLVR